jgi:DNA invertase Pin-like site-specific DNA recombinase
MTLYGYFRCSTTDQHEERQIRALKDANCQVIRGDKITGTSDFNSRPELTALLNEMESGSTLVLSELSRLSRSFIGMVNEVSKLLERGMHIKTLDGRLDTTAMPKEITMLIVSILGYAASQELEQIKTRTAEGRSVALSKGVKFGAKRKYDKYQIQEIMHKRDLGQGYGQIAKAMGMSRSTVSTIVKRELDAEVGIQ